MIILRRIIYFLLFFVLPFPLFAAPPAVQEYNLKNGLKLLVKEDHRAPVVVSQVWYKVGSSYEYGGITGVSHMLEHMMFQGTKTLDPGEFSRIIAENGGSENAFTSRDYTAYFQRLEKSRLAVSFRLEADRMRRLKLREEEFVKEREVVMEERRMRTDDKPRAKMQELFQAVAHSNGGYKNPVIGWPDDIKNWTINDLKKWYQMWYAPNNAILVVAGDVNSSNVYRLAKKYFGPLQPSVLDPVKPRTEVKQHGERRMVVKLPAKLPYLVMGFKVPGLHDVEREWEAYALEVLASVLSGGGSTRFPRRLVREQQIAVSADAGYDGYGRLPSLFYLDATPVQGKSLTELEAAIKAEIHELKENTVAIEELDRIKSQVLANAIYERDSIFYQAMQIGTLETVGLGWERMEEYVDRISRVTPHQIQHVAQKYLVDDDLTVAFLEPLPMEQKKPTKKTVGGHHAH